LKIDLEFLNGFATRVVQLADLPAKLPENKLTLTDDEEKKHTVTFKSNRVLAFLRGLTDYGANPFRQVISGAGLCLSDGAILDLPPYSNMRQNVMWIDDHLKYSLHHELGHFDIHIGEVGHARVGAAQFDQLRLDSAPTYNDVRWHIKNYMLRLLMGCVADGWLRAVPALKKALTKQHTRQQLQQAKKLLRQHVPHLYASEFLETMLGVHASSPDPDRRKRFKQLLWESALARLKYVVECWSRPEFKGTFLDLFVSGLVPVDLGRFRDYFCGYLPKKLNEGLSKAVEQLPTQVPSGSLEGEDFDNLSLTEALQVLVDDLRSIWMSSDSGNSSYTQCDFC